MGLHLCSRHGAQSGPHCCLHVQEAVLGSTENSPNVVQFKRDLLGDGEIVLEYRGCASCAALCDVNEGETLILESDSILDSWPPTCHICVDAWLEKNGSGPN